jgi:thimet oligopeptidase
MALTVEGLTRLCDGSLATADAIAGELRALALAKDEALTWEATFGKFDDERLALMNGQFSANLMNSVHPDKGVKDAAAACKKKVKEKKASLYLDAAIYRALRRAAPKSASHSPVRKRLVDIILRDFKRNGMDLDAAGQAKLRELDGALVGAEQAFQTNLIESKDGELEIMPAQLAGLPDDFRAAHKPQANGTITLSTKPTDLGPFLRHAKDRRAARALYVLSKNKAEKNLPVLDTLLRLRHAKAKLLGYETWAHYVLEERMAKTPAAVARLLDGVHAQAAPKMAERVKKSRAIYAKVGGKTFEPIFEADASYLEFLLGKDQHGPDPKVVKEYFEATGVRRGIMDITTRLFGVTYRPLPTAPKWHPEVEAIEVIDKDQTILGTIYLDLYSRENKQKGTSAVCYTLRQGRAGAHTIRPTVAIVANFSRPGDGEKASLLSQSQTEVFFHEFGHALHALFNRSELASFAWWATADEFLEAAPELFAQFAYAPETLGLFAKHYQTGDPMPDKLRLALVRERSDSLRRHAAWDVREGAFDLAYHTREPGFDTTQVYNDITTKYWPYAPVAGAHPQASEWHLGEGGVNLYAYTWARALAYDMLTRFKREGLLNPATAADFRAAIMAPGADEDEAKMVEHFLGRPPNGEAYGRALGE